MGLARVLLIIQVAAGSVLVLLGSLAEGFGYGLSMGTSWPYRRDIVRLALRADPEAWHRILATAVGLNAMALAAILRSPGAWLGLGLSAAAALLGMATLHVLADRAPAFLHGLHELLAYGTLLAYASQVGPGTAPWALLRESAPLHAFLLMVFLGGLVAGQRGYKTAIGPFVVPRTAGQWMFALHVAGWLVCAITLAFTLSVRSAALAVALLQVLLGFALYQSVNASPGRPGIPAVLHQAAALLLFFCLVFSWRIPAAIAAAR